MQDLLQQILCCEPPTVCWLVNSKMLSIDAVMPAYHTGKFALETYMCTHRCCAVVRFAYCCCKDVSRHASGIILKEHVMHMLAVLGNT